jgi:hypothetical protein
VGSSSDAPLRLEGPGMTDSNSFNDSVASPESAGAVGAAVENFIGLTHSKPSAIRKIACYASCDL